MEKRGSSAWLRRAGAPGPRDRIDSEHNVAIDEQIAEINSRTQQCSWDRDREKEEGMRLHVEARESVDPGKSVNLTVAAALQRLSPVAPGEVESGEQAENMSCYPVLYTAGGGRDHDWASCSSGISSRVQVMSLLITGEL